MKKLVIFAILLVALFLWGVYLIIPGRNKIQEQITIKASLTAVSRSLMQDANWNKWWPGKTPFSFQGKTYVIRGKVLNSIETSIMSGKDSLPGRMDLVVINTDSMSVGWETELFSGNNLFKRFAQYREVKALRKEMSTILESMKAFMEKTENIYGIHVIETQVTDSILISMRRSFSHPPGVEEIDTIIKLLKKYIKENKAVEKNYPMLNIPGFGVSGYEVMVAIPVDRKLPETKEYILKFMLKGGRILETQVTGGPFTVEKAFKELDNFRADYNFTSPAIPYQLLVTDRTKETDTTKWITRLYYPVF